MNTIGGFKCKCPPKWMGDLCDQGTFSSFSAVSSI